MQEQNSRKAVMAFLGFFLKSWSRFLLSLQCRRLLQRHWSPRDRAPPPCQVFPLVCPTDAPTQPEPHVPLIHFVERHNNEVRWRHSAWNIVLDPSLSRYPKLLATGHPQKLTPGEPSPLNYTHQVILGEGCHS